MGVLICLAGAESGEAGILVETNFAMIKNTSDLLEDEEQPEPAWLDFFTSPAWVMGYESSYIAPEGKYSKEETLTALDGMRSCLEEHGGRWQASPRWNHAYGDSDDMLRFLGWAIDHVRRTPAESRFNSVIQEN